MRDLPPAPYAYGLQDFDSSEEVTIVKRTGQTVLPQVTYLTTPQSDPTPLVQVQVQKQTPAATVSQPLPVPLPLQQQQKPAKLPKKTPPLQKLVLPAGATSGGGSSMQLTVPGGTSATITEPQQPTASNGSPEQTSLMEVELETAPRPEDMPQPAELDNDIPQHQKRNVYSKYATEVQPGGCGCGGYVLVEKKIYVCEPKETIVRLMKRSHDDVCEAQETQHVGVIRTPENPEQMFQLIPMQGGVEQ
uniref:Uncharacterized protein n=1 Tax=Anopheles dirus TaxID=7168 RepID=A0A182NID4_9DIPT